MVPVEDRIESLCQFGTALLVDAAGINPHPFQSLLIGLETATSYFLDSRPIWDPSLLHFLERDLLLSPSIR